MELNINMAILVVALAAIVKATLATNAVTFAIALFAVTEASLITNTITLAITMATFATAKPRSFSYYGVMTREDDGNGCKDIIICYAVQDDAGGEDWEGYFKGCHDDETTPGGFMFSPILADGTFELDLGDIGKVDEKSSFAAFLTHVASGVDLIGFEKFEAANDLALSEYPNAITVWGNGVGGWVHKPMENPTCKGW